MELDALEARQSQETHMPDASLCARLSVGVLLVSLHPGEVGVVTPVLWIVQLSLRGAQ